MTRRHCLAVLLTPWLTGTTAAQGQGPGEPAEVELNHATQAELEQLPGLGPALSEQLLATRRADGPFTDWPDLIRRLKGVGPAKARRWSDAGLRVSGQAYPSPSPR